MLGRKYLLIIFSLPFFAFGYLTASNVSSIYAGQKCDAVLDLDKSIDKNKATVKNNSASCDHEVTLALYDSPQNKDTFGWIEAQIFLGSDTKIVKSGETVNFFVEDIGVTCLRQADLFKGREIKIPPIYVNNLETAVYDVPCATPTIINTPTPTNIPTPTQTPTPGPTSTPTPEPTATPTPGESISQVVLASTGNISFIYAIILAGAISLVAGMILRKASK